MYSTCIFCHGRLGANEVVEALPVGRRLAFDPGKGRLWVLCPGCRQWNLSPIEERWEALESLERLYRDTPKRYSTEQISLAKHREGLELVRIGEPTRPEYAAWRYGGELLRRRRKFLVGGTVAVAGGALIAGGASAGLIAGGAFNILYLTAMGHGLHQQLIRTAARVEGPDGVPLRLRDRHTKHAALTREGDGWGLSFPHVLDTPEARKKRWKLLLTRGLAGAGNPAHDPVVTLKGATAVRAAGRILPNLNQSGASGRRVTDAAAFLEEAGPGGGAGETFRRAADASPRRWSRLTVSTQVPANALLRLPASVRLALEMAAHEESERRAMEGELSRLEREWREAEEVAAIADDLLLPEKVRALFPGR